jgi:tetratricopeptide (TPR) repeat protein
MGNAHAHIGNLDDAREHLERSLELDEDDLDLAAPTAAQLLSLYLEVGDLDAARELTERMSSVDEPHLLAAMASAAEVNGDSASAEKFRNRLRASTYLPDTNPGSSSEGSSSSNQKPN